MTPVSVVKILSYILAGFYSAKWLAVCSDLSKMDVNPNDSLHYPATSMNEEVSNLETTTILPDYDGQIKGFQVSDAEEDFLKADPITSDSVFEDMSSNNSDDKKSNSKRDALLHGIWNHANKIQVMQLHNLYRRNVTPTAGNMAYMEWDTELERLAQIWANNCSRQHGGYGNVGIIGQNIDILDTDPTGYRAIYRWNEERRYYNLRTGQCIPNKKCGHYVQMAWAESTKLGCAIAKCEISYFLVCNYSPAALHGVQMYRVAEPCSHCSEKNVLCFKNLCMTPNQCKNNPFACQDAKCNLKCHNCGRLDNKTCTCECTDGWDGPDCTQLCKNKDKMCEKSPGYPDENSCSLHKYTVANTLCRKMCETCHAMEETSTSTCCGTKLCEDGYVLDPSGKTCECLLHCPGPICDCPFFEIRKDMSIVYSKNNEGETVATFSCHNNTKLIGSNTSECQPDGKWSISLPYCEDITCPLFEIGKNMNIVYSKNNKVDSVATFSCHNNTKLVGSKTSECQPDGKWSISLPYCEDEEEAILNFAAVMGGGAESLRTFPCITVWMFILKFVEIYINTLSPDSFQPADGIF